MPKGSVGDCLGALSGAAAVGLYGVYIALIDTNDVATDLGPEQSADTIAQALVANRDDAQTAAYFGLAGAFLLLWFFGYLRRQLQRAEGEDGWLTSLAYGGGLVVVGLVLLTEFLREARERRRNARLRDGFELGRVRR